MLRSPNPQDYLPLGKDKNAQSYADLMPRNKKLWASVNISDTIVRKFLEGLAGELDSFQDLEFVIASTYIPNFDDSMIDRWEELVGIPDKCFPNDGTDAERRRNIIIKLAFMNLQTQQDYFDLAAILGLTIEISYADTNDAFTYTFPVTLFTKKEAQFTWFINIIEENLTQFSYTFPIAFEQTNSALFQCICEQQKNASTNLIFTFEPVIYIDGANDIYTDGDGNEYTP